MKTDWNALDQTRAQLEEVVRRDLTKARQARDDAQAALEAAQYELEKLAVDSHRNNRLKSIEIEQLAGFKHSSWHKLVREWKDTA